MVDLEPMVTRDMLTSEMHTIGWDFVEKLTLAGLHDEGQAGGEGVTGLLGLGHCEGWGGFWGGLGVGWRWDGIKKSGARGRFSVTEMIVGSKIRQHVIYRL